MATPAQIAANRRNALKSTGPRTPAGKAASSRNALKHGLDSRTLLCSEPVQEEIRQIEANFATEYPARTLETRSLLRRLAEAIWRRDYALLLEKETWDRLLEENPQNEPNLQVRLGRAFLRGTRLFSKIVVFLNRAEREFYKVLNALDVLRIKIPQNEPNFPAAHPHKIRSAVTTTAAAVSSGAEFSSTAVLATRAAPFPSKETVPIHAVS
jgi:hypothetical protein